MTRSRGSRPYLHETVSAALRNRITNREHPPGSILPSEKHLTEEFGVSRSVVREALRTLAEEGHIHIIPGRGSVVATRQEWHRDAQRTAGLSAQMHALGTRVGTQVLTYHVGPDDHAKSIGSRQVLLLERLRFLDGEPVAFIRTWLPDWVAQKVRADHLVDTSLHEQVHERTGRQIHGGRRQIRAVSIAGDLASHLAVPEGSPVLLLEGESLDQDGAVIEVFATWHRSDRIALDIAEPRPGSREATGITADALGPIEEAAAETLRRIRRLR